MRIPPLLSAGLLALLMLAGCRAGTTTRFSHGDDPTYLEIPNFAWCGHNSGSTTHPVGTRRPNPWGLFDMHGNVWEWCLDHYDAKFYAKFPTDTVTLGPVNKPTDKKWLHTVRGGSWADKPY